MESTDSTYCNSGQLILLQGVSYELVNMYSFELVYLRNQPFSSCFTSIVQIIGDTWAKSLDL